MPMRMLHDLLLGYKGENCYVEILMPWLKENQSEVGWLCSLSQRAVTSIPKATDEELWRLYALSRVLELLALHFQKGDGTDWPGPEISRQQFDLFAESLGIRVEYLANYHPFSHEVVELIPISNRFPQIIQHHWAGLMLGNMRMLRAGVTLSASPTVLRPGIADSSTLYWAYRRKNRPYQDLSQGWGSNSSWRTRFRRDYKIENTLYFNVDGTEDLMLIPPELLDDAGLNKEERVELLVNRSFVITDKAHDDLWPYDDKFICPFLPE
ncbi:MULTISPECIES: hypothetical protein [unclassified Serratia (in: enterobacteria)]|uniref:hypothetical protein n=1 Tax=unclassified Serratia (in: enterobacteria) TaxID=2647522 RepID=UPI0004687C23|nr:MULTISPECIES: hypothetical protein [unclassified Serratia (in: enterobacteria)]